jgi:hypothetical protein
MKNDCPNCDSEDAIVTNGGTMAHIKCRSCGRAWDWPFYALIGELKEHHAKELAKRDAQIAELRNALRPFAEAWEKQEREYPTIVQCVNLMVSAEDFEAAHNAMKERHNEQ